LDKFCTNWFCTNWNFVPIKIWINFVPKLLQSMVHFSPWFTSIYGALVYGLFQSPPVHGSGHSLFQSTVHSSSRPRVHGSFHFSPQSTRVHILLQSTRSKVHFGLWSTPVQWFKVNCINWLSTSTVLLFVKLMSKMKVSAIWNWSESAWSIKMTFMDRQFKSFYMSTM